MEIIFEKVRAKNFFSYGNTFTEIDLNSHKSSLLIGLNGSGKTTIILDALCIVLFNKPFKKISKTKVLNPINKKDCVVEVEFSIGKKRYNVIRGIKPNIFEIYCNDKLIEQNVKSMDYQEYLETYILKMSYKTFTQITIIGKSNYVNFMELSTPDRRLFIDNLLDIQVFSVMSELNKKKIKDNKEALDDNDREIRLVRDRIDIQKKSIDESKNKNHDLIQLKQNQIKENLDKIQKFRDEVFVLDGKVEEFYNIPELPDSSELEVKKQKYLTLKDRFENTIKTNKKDILFYKEHDDCPVCTQHIDEEFKTNQITTKDAKNTELYYGLDKLTKEIANVNNQIAENKKIENEIREYNNKISEYKNQIYRINLNINNLISTNERLENEIKDLSVVKVVDETKLFTLQDELENLLSIKSNLEEERTYLNYSSTLLKDDTIKAKIIKKYIPILNTLVNKYLKLLDFFVSFNLDENFNEVIKSRHRDEFVYNNFSEGQKQKIDLALLFSFRDLGRIKNRSNTNLLVLDEVLDGSLDNEGTMNLLNIFRSFEDVNLFVMSHTNVDIYSDVFERVINVKVVKNFSQIEV